MFGSSGAVCDGSRSQGSRARACRSAGAGRKSQRVCLCEVPCPAPMDGWSRLAGLAGGSRIGARARACFFSHLGPNKGSAGVLPV